MHGFRSKCLCTKADNFDEFRCSLLRTTDFWSSCQTGELIHRLGERILRWNDRCLPSIVLLQSRWAWLVAKQSHVERDQ